MKFGPQKLDLTTMDIAAEKRKQLKNLFPEIFTEDKVDFDALRRVLGDIVDSSKERFGLNWPGKADCMKVIQAPSVATLKPCREESVDFDASENLFIEGDNLEVLKLLQKSYFGQVKMIYIDPPYNTGNEFIYPDKFAENLDTYMEYTGQKDAEGRTFSTNADTAGRFHSNWLNMMYPRLYLAKNLLREDGVIFISIDDHEQANLKALCDQVFGEENFLGTFVWKRRSGAMDAVSNVSEDHEYILAYSRHENQLNGIKRSFEKYSNPDGDVRGDWISDNLSAGKPGGDTYYAIIDPSTGNEFWPPKGRYWPYSSITMATKIEEGRVIFPKLSTGTPMLKRFKSEAMKAVLPVSTWIEAPNKKNPPQGALITPLNSQATKDLKSLFGDKVFLYPKPYQLIEELLSQGATKNSIVLDLFAGSGTTAHGVLSYNAKHNTNMKYITVQLPEPVENDSAARKIGMYTIADIGKERIRRVGAVIKAENEGSLDLDGAGDLDLGFKVFKLDTSNFKIWDGDANAFDEVQLDMHVDHIDAAAEAEDILYELLLKSGFELTTTVERLTLADKEVFSIADGALLICLDKNLTSAVIDAMAEADPIQVICLDEGFKGNDQLKTNAVQTFAARAAASESEIIFRTV
ncbi:MAG: site-specific DNA-methyltransferase [Aliivibrio sp.]|uniref:site-specific DNA-methyltransferase n=1 Tax=Aliivibrio sp. TaxID=1872443 RepID=UPI001A4331EB|nr:site-specific DNA-methyltransferase [Aliivibrio sp.]